MKISRILICFFLLVFVLVPFTWAQDSLNVSFVAKTLNALVYTSDMAVEGYHAYVLSDSKINILNISDPTIPQFVGEIKPLDFNHDIEIVNNYAYVSASSSSECRLFIYDVSNPGNPMLLDSINISDYCTKITTCGNFLYIYSYIGKIKIYDISDHVNPVLAGSMDISGNINSIIVHGDFIYVAKQFFSDTYVNGIQIFNISVPSEPVDVSFYELSSKVSDITVSGNYVYCAVDRIGLKIVNISDPANPQTEGTYSIEQDFRCITIHNNNIYMSGNSLHILAIGNPHSPQYVASIDSLRTISQIIVKDNLAFVAAEGFIIFDVTYPNAVYEIGRYKISYALTVAVKDCIAYVLTHDSLHLINISNPESPVLLSSIKSIVWPQGIALQNNYAFISLGNGNLLIIDITNPLRPYIHNSLNIGAYGLNKIAISGEYAYITGYEFLQVINIASPSYPYLTSTLHYPFHTDELVLSDNYAFVYSSHNGLYIVDVSDKTNVRIVSSSQKYGYPSGLALINNEYLCLGNSGRELKIVNISDPYDLFTVSNYHTPGSLCDVTVSGDYALISGNYSGLRILNISNPENPYVTGYYNTIGKTNGIAVFGNYAFVADNLSLSIFDISAAIPPVIYPEEVSLTQNYPNPFNLETNISFDIPVNGFVDLSIYNVKGQKISTLFSKRTFKGTHNIIWNGKDSSGKIVSSGVYFSKLTSGGKTRIKKMLLMK